MLKLAIDIDAIKEVSRRIKFGNCKIDNILQRKEYNILKNLSHIPEVKEADVVFGYYDIICKIETSEYKTLENIITKAIRKLPHVRTTMTLNVFIEQES